MPDLDLTITICSWNTIGDLRACLQSLREAQKDGAFEVIVVDNASHDGSPDMVASEFPEFTLLRERKNHGFTGGHNLALRARTRRHTALLNSDTVVHEGAIKAIYDFMLANPEAGVVGPKLLNPDGSLQYSCRRFPNPIAAAFRGTFLGRLFPNNKLTTDYLMMDWDHASVREVDWVSGAAMFLRGDLLDKIGLLDPKYFMYCEDEDLCWRAWEAGYKVLYLPDAVITHAIGRSSDQAANRMIVRFHRSMLRFYRKRLVTRHPLPARPFLVVLAAVALGARAAMLLAKNYFDVLVRMVKR